jgi:hypothetical protein
LLLLSAGIWFEGIYPYQVAKRLNASIAEERYTLDTYQLLRSIPFYSARADRMWATLFDRRATNAERRGERAEALLWRLKALSVLPTEQRRREATLLIGEDYALHELSDRPGTNPVRGDPQGLLHDWEKRLKLKINEANGQIEPMIPLPPGPRPDEGDLRAPPENPLIKLTLDCDSAHGAGCTTAETSAGGLLASRDGGPRR